MSDFDAVCGDAFAAITAGVGAFVDLRIDAVDHLDVSACVDRDVAVLDEFGAVVGRRIRVEYLLADAPRLAPRRDSIRIDGSWRHVEKIEAEDGVSIKVLLA